MVKIVKKETESSEALLRRFNRMVQQSGLLTQAKEKKYRKKEISRVKRRMSAIRKAARGEFKRRTF